jgi:trk system potassium uptake protein TrkH
VGWKNILRVLGFLLVFLAVCMLLPLFWARYYGTPDWWAFAVTIPMAGVPGLLLLRCKDGQTIGVRDSYLIVTCGWLVSSLVAAIPFMLSGVLTNPLDAVFESVSGFTTTGATVMTNIQMEAAGILFWRSFLNWLGGMGIIVFFLAFLPKMGMSGASLFKAEVPGPEKERLTPRLRQTASMLWAIYGGITILETGLLCLAGMNLYEALIHSFSTVSTGGFSNKGLSISAFSNPWIHYIILLFMLLAGINFTLYYKMISTKKFNPGLIFRDSEVQVYLMIILTAVVIIGMNLSSSLGWSQALHHGSFQVVSIMTTSGFTTADFDIWPDLSRAVLLLLMFVGGCSCSTSGSIKVVRYIVLFKSVLRELNHMVHARAVLPIRIGRQVVPENIVRAVLVFVCAWLGCAMFGTLFMLVLGLDLISAVSAVAATLGNIGPGLGLVGPALNYALIPAPGKVLLTGLMLLGRLELFTVLVIMSRTFWR